MTPRIAAALALATLPSLAPAIASAEASPRLSGDVAARVLLAEPTESKVERNPVFANAQGLVASTTCRFKDANELVGQGSRARPAKIDANPAFLALNPGSSAASYAVKEKRMVFASHVFGKRVSEALGKDPDGAVLSTHEVARQVPGRL